MIIPPFTQTLFIYKLNLILFSLGPQLTITAQDVTEPDHYGIPPSCGCTGEGMCFGFFVDLILYR